jgi:ATP-binding protein involved in chromosome partitioning
MLIAVPTIDGQLCMHFGHCETFTMLEVDPDKKEITSEKKLTPPPHEPGLLPRWLHSEGVSVVIAGGMGQRAQSLFAQNGVKVVVGAPAASPSDTVMAYLNGTLAFGDNVCDH